VGGNGKGIVLRNALAAPVHKTLWANGTVAAQDTCNTGACVMDTSRAFHTTDISSELPAGAPVQIEVELTYQQAAVNIGGFDTWVQSDQATFYSYTYDSSAGHVLVRVTLLAGGTTQVVMAAFGPEGSGAETPYTLRIALAADPTGVPPSVPVSVALGPGSSIAATAKGAPVPFLLYSPTDVALGESKGNRTLAATAPKGEYIVLLPPDSPWANLTTDSGDARMTVLGLRFEMGTEGTLPPNGAYDSSWDVAGSPLGVGVLAHTVPSAIGPAPLVSAGFQMTLTGPNGFRLESSTLCQICFNFGGNYWGIGSALGDGKVTAGNYAIHAQTDATYDIRVAPFAIYAQRLASP
jgi:hypothetical protein